MAERVVLVTGASAGFGRLLVGALPGAALGYRYVPVASMRDVAGRNAPVATELREGGIDVVEIDVTDDASVERGVAETLDRHGRIDVLVNNAGFGLTGPLEAATVDDLRSVFETNVFGTHRMVRAALPSMREREAGLLVHVSSGAGRLAFPSSGAYCSTKWALEAMGETLRYELAPLGIDSVLVEPGRYETDFHTRSLSRVSDIDRAAAYPFVDEGIHRRNEVLKAGDASEVVDVIVGLIDTPRGERPTRTFVQPGGRDVLAELNAMQSQLAEGVLSLFGDDRFGSNGF